MIKTKKQQLGDNLRQLSDQQLREMVHKLQLKDASNRLDIAKLKEQIQEIQIKYNKALKQIGEMEKIQKRDYDYILKIESFFAKIKPKPNDIELKAKQLLFERDSLLQQNLLLMQKLHTNPTQPQKQLIPQESQQQFQAPKSNDEEIAHDYCLKPKFSTSSNYTQDTMTHEEEDPLKAFLGQLDQEQVDQLHDLFQSLDKGRKCSDSVLIRKMLSDTEQSNYLESQESAFSFSQCNKERF